MARFQAEQQAQQRENMANRPTKKGE